MNGIIYALLGTAFTFLLTTLGAANVFFVKKNVNQNVQCLFLGFAGGVMIAASIWSLLVPGIEAAQSNHQIGWLVTSGGFLLGVVLLLAVDLLLKGKIKKLHENGKKLPLTKKTAMLLMAITIHNIPEGMAVGMAFAFAAQELSNANIMSGAIALALGIGIQNYPEGMAVTLPLLKDGISKKKAFIIGSLSAAVEPAFGVIAAALAGMASPLMPLLLSFAAGTMIYVVVEELIPEAHLGEKENIGTLGFVVGFLVMMILDVALG
ncbi:ZIP family metal transporter [bacterium D16-51]|nr:ZIP family metal transporter [bacterium D16-59]RKI62647.1 ZIP family metal transporter [bacterium D16-51]